MTGLMRFFENIEDPRVERTQQHKFIDIITITIASVICGCEDWNEIELFGNLKKEWLSQFLANRQKQSNHSNCNRSMQGLKIY